MNVSMDVSEVGRLAADLGKAGPAVVPLARAVVEKGALNVKNGMARDATGIGHAPAFPRSITYDVRGLSAEIGPDKGRRQGALGNILAFGTSKNAPVWDHTAAIRREEPFFMQHLQRVAAEALRL